MRYAQLSPTIHQIAWTGVVLRFEYRFDRWAHVISQSSAGEEPGGAEVVWLSSGEGAAENATPPSPAFQDLRWEPLEVATAESSPDSTASADEISVGEFQLFGQCGRQVYSAAIRCTAGRIDFDLCVRVRGGEPFQLLSSYDCPVLAINENGVTLIGGRLQVETISLPNEPVLTCQCPSPDRIVLAAEPVVLPVKKSQTLRWAYRLSWDV